MYIHPSSSPFRLSLLSLFLVASSLTNVGVSAKAILGVDLGSLFMKVALVQRNSPLEIVTNLHSKRKTEVMVLFDQGSRFYGADASSLIARKPHLTPSALGVMLGREEGHPAVQALSDRHYPITPSYNSTRSGLSLQVAGSDYTPEELVAMVLDHAKEITGAFSTGGTAVKDCVLTVPSFYTQKERLALLDAAQLADLNVLSLIDENTAAALHFGMDRIEEEGKPYNVIFYNMGSNAVQASVVQFFSYDRKEGKYSKQTKKVGAFEVLGKGWDLTLGGSAFDAKIMDFMAEEFNQKWNAKRSDGVEKDVRKFPRPVSKLRIQANKAKHVLSANTGFPLYIDSLYDDTTYSSHITREKFEEISKDLIDRSTQPIEMALKQANMTLDEIDAIELIGGGMRIPKVQDQLQNYLGEKLDLGLHINSDESMALGAAFHGANVSTAFRVRHVGMEDINPFPIQISLSDESDSTDEEEEKWSKQSIIFKPNGKLGVKKTVAFTHDQDVLCSVDYAPSSDLPQGTSPEIEHYKITGVETFAKEMQEKKGLENKKPKISLQFELSNSGIIKLIKAEANVEEIFTVTEEVEVEDDEESESEEGEKAEGEADSSSEEAEATETEAETKEDGASEGEEEKPKKKKKTKTVEKEKKKVHKRSLTIESSYVGKVQPYSSEIMAESKAKLEYLAQKDRERIALEEAKNKVESYIYYIKNKMSDDEKEIATVTTEEQRTFILNLATTSEDWLYDDGYDADLATFEDKYVELSEPAEAIFTRQSELKARPSAGVELKKKLQKIEDLMLKWENDKPQITQEEREEVMELVNNARKWLDDMEMKQASNPAYETPVYFSQDVPKQAKPIEQMVAKLNKRPKPKVEKKKEEEEKKEKDENATDAEAEGADADGEEEVGNEDEASTTSEDAKEEGKEEEKKGEDEL